MLHPHSVLILNAHVLSFIKRETISNILFLSIISKFSSRNMMISMKLFLQGKAQSYHFSISSYSECVSPHNLCFSHSTVSILLIMLVVVVCLCVCVYERERERERLSHYF
jgi:formate hydrogenlyase subunit 3/multisubunit Na+/H+ antiporter MnhD subunit